MAALGTGLWLLFVVLCILASVCDARGGRGGGRGRSSRYRSSSGGSGGGGGGGIDAGLIVGIIFGSIAGIIVLGVLYAICKTYCCGSSSEDSAKPTSSVVSNPTTSRPVTGPQHNGHKPSHTKKTNPRVQPPSYETAISQKEGPLPYPSQPNEDFSYPPVFSYSTNASELPYPANPPPSNGAYGAPYPSASAPPDKRHGGRALGHQNPGPTGFEKTSYV